VGQFEFLTEQASFCAILVTLALNIRTRHFAISPANVRSAMRFGHLSMPKKKIVLWSIKQKAAAMFGLGLL
jgi:hypothetical protein